VEESPPAGRVTDETDYLRLADNPRSDLIQYMSAGGALLHAEHNSPKPEGARRAARRRLTPGFSNAKTHGR
jgi:hypothetical protein